MAAAWRWIGHDRLYGRVIALSTALGLRSPVASSGPR